MDSETLATGELEILGLLAGSSNYTFLAQVGDDPDALAVYKPRRGEAPLWDFISGTLCNREVAAHLVCAAAGWGIVPPTVLREGPHGIGAVQQFIEHDPAVTAFDLVEDRKRELMQIALFDVVANNADRKAGHVLVGADGTVWGIDHGLCFHEEPKLRTVLWDYIGDPVPENDLAAVQRLLTALDGELCATLGALLVPEELEALTRRARWVVDNKIFPSPGPGRPYPWPPI